MFKLKNTGRSLIAGMSAVAAVLFGLGAGGHATPTFKPEIAFTETLPPYEGQGWFWVSGNRAPNMTDSRAFLFNKEGKQLGQLSTGFWFNTLDFAHSRNELVAVETYFSRGTRGERTDIVAFYDAETLAPTGEVVIPSKRMTAVRNTGLSYLSEDERFLAVVNYTPAQSVSIVDLEERRFVEEVETPGCSVLYSAGPRDFYSICGNGAFMHLRLGEDGRVVLRERSDPLFPPVKDFLTISASRIGNVWYFVSRQSHVYAIEMTPDSISVVNKFSLTSDFERRNDWRIAGMQHTAVHAATNRLFVIMGQGSEETFEDPGTVVWVYDVETGEKIDEIPMVDLSASIAVSQGQEPHLLSLDMHIQLGTLYTIWVYLTEGEAGVMRYLTQRVNIYDADEGDHLNSTDVLPNGFVLNVLAW